MSGGPATELALKPGTDAFEMFDAFRQDRRGHEHVAQEVSGGRAAESVEGFVGDRLGHVGEFREELGGGGVGQPVQGPCGFGVGEQRVGDRP